MSITARFDKIITPTMVQVGGRAMVIGLGSVGRPLTQYLLRAGTKITTYDHDDVDLPNVGTQGYHRGDLGSPKVIAMEEEAHNILGDDIAPFRYKGRREEFICTPEQMDDAINNLHIFVAVDSMRARQAIYAALTRLDVDHTKRFLYDTRCGAFVGNIQSVCLGDEDARAKYERSLFDDSKASPARCGMETMPHCPAFAAALTFQAYCSNINAYSSDYDCKVYDLRLGTLDCESDAGLPGTDGPVSVETAIPRMYGV